MNAAPWWLRGDRRCEHCLQLHVVEMEYRCTACDGPVCHFCVVTVRAAAATLCPGCEA